MLKHHAGADIPRVRIAIASLAMFAVALTSCTVTTKHTSNATATPSARSEARFDKGGCQFALGAGFVEGKNVTCGYVTVPADHAQPNGGKIRLAVAIFQNPSARRAPDPVIFLQGGPGGRVIQDFAPAIVTSASPGNGQISLPDQFGNHDLIMVDQRGTGYSQPSLQCPEVVNLQYQTDVSLTAQQQADEQNQQLDVSHKRLAAAGVNFNDYTTLSDAADIHDLIGALGYKQVDLYGVSYGTRLALEIMRSYPQGVRSVVLDSTVPAQSHLLLSVPSSTARVFNVLFQGCASDPTCNATYPHLDTTFYSLVTQLNAQPVTFQTTDFNTNKQYTVLFNGDALVNVFFNAFYATPYIPYLPEMIHEASQGTYTHLVTLLYGALQFDDSVSWGDYYSVECAEDVAHVTAAQVTAAAQAYPAAIRQDQLIGLVAELPGCQAWGVTPAPASEAQAVSSAIPTIILEGEYDPITPPANGALAAQTLSTSYQFQFPGTGHGAFLSTFTPGNCPATIVNAFWTNPTTKPDGGCTATMPEPQFQ